MTKGKKKPAKGKKKPAPQSELKKLDKETLFGYAYLKHKGNATRAAMEVFNCTERTAWSWGHHYVRKPKVQEIIKEAVWQARAGMDYVVEQMKKMVEDPDTEPEMKLKVLSALARFAGEEPEESAYTPMKVRRGSFVGESHPALPTPTGTVPGNTNLQLNDRRTIFHLYPPPIPAGGIPPPALIDQWKDGLPLPATSEENTAHDDGPARSGDPAPR